MGGTMGMNERFETSPGGVLMANPMCTFMVNIFKEFYFLEFFIMNYVSAL